MAQAEDQGAGQGGRVVIALVGGVLALAGYFLPWYSFVFAPPHGYFIINGEENTAFTYAYSGLNPVATATSSAGLLHTTVISLIVIGVINVIRLIPLPEVVTNKAIEIVAGIFHSNITGTVLNLIQALGHIILSLLLIAFLVLVVGLEHIAGPALIANRLGGGPDAVAASQYVSFHFGIGLFVMLAGFVIGGLAVLKEIAIVVGILLVVIIALVLFHPTALGSFFHLLGF
jgi:hypothetical protein